MDEQRWVAEQRHAQRMLRALCQVSIPRAKFARKLRLFACGCVRLWWDNLTDDLFRQAINVAERFSDGSDEKEQLIVAHEAACALLYDVSGSHYDRQRSKQAAYMATKTCFPEAFEAASMVTLDPPDCDGQTLDVTPGEQKHCDLLRCVFGNPFRKPVFPKKWRTETVTALAAGIYEGRAFDRLPILADALDEAGCEDPAMLAHLRGDGPHCRGCWVVDLALGK